MRYDFIVYRFVFLGLISVALVACGGESIYTSTAETDLSANTATGGDTNTAGTTTTDNEPSADSGTATDNEQASGGGNTDLTLRLLWVEPVGHVATVGSPLVSDADIIITNGRARTDDSTQIKAYSSTGLIENWALNPDTTTDIQSHSEVVGDLNGNVYALRFLEDDDRTVRLVTRSATGQLMPDYQGGGGRASTAPSIDASGRVIFINSDNDIAVREQDGTITFISETNSGFMRSKPAISRANVAYFTNDEEGLVSVNLTTRERAFCSGSQSSWSSPAIAGNNNIIFGTQSGRIMACNQNMSRIWAYPDDDLAVANANNCNSMNDTATIYTNVTGSPVIDAANDIYIRSHNGYIYALNAEGKLRWCHNTGITGASPFPEVFPTATPILTANGYLIYVDSNGIVALDTANGELALRMARDDLGSDLSGFVSTPTITPSGLLIVRAGQNLLAFQTNTTLDTDAFWPKWGADLKNSGLQP